MGNKTAQIQRNAQDYEQLVIDYFGTTISGAYGVSNDGFLKIEHKDESHGYVFAYPLQLNRNHEARLRMQMRIHKALGKNIERFFVDNRPNHQIAGFEWIKPVKERK